MAMNTYHATLYTPLFYSSSEGVILASDRTLGSTALSYAFAYYLGYLKKRYFLYGKEAENHQYCELAKIKLFVSDGKPIDVNFKEETFKSTEYLSERRLTVTISKETDPAWMGSRSPIPINKVRRYVGLAPGSTFEVTAWSEETLPDDLLLTLGIRRSGELRLKKTKPASKVHLNIYMLSQVYGLDEETILELYKSSGKLVRGSDYRKHHIIDVDVKLVNDRILPLILGG